MIKFEKKIFPVDAILLIGPTGVGKSPLGDEIEARGLFGRRCHHLDFGSELRNAVLGGVRSSPYTAAELDFLNGVLERGLLLENEQFVIAQKIISVFLGRVGFSLNDILVLNGIPRHAGQAGDMEKITRVHAVVVLDCTAEIVLCRIQANTGGDRTERPDDNPELIQKKLKIFRERTSSLANWYAKKGAVVWSINVTERMTAEEAYRNISFLSAVHPPVSFIAKPPEG